MSTSHLSHAINALASRRGLTLSDLASQIGLSQSNVSRLAGNDQRPDVPTLRAIGTRPSYRSDGIQLLVAHLRDEIERAGRLQSEVTISVDQKESPVDIRLIEERCQTDPELRAIIHDLAEMVRAHQRKEARALYAQPEPAVSMAAEDAPISTPTVAQLAAAEKKRRAQLRIDQIPPDAGRKAAPTLKAARHSSP